MICHQHIRVDRTVRPAGTCLQHAQVNQVVAIRKKARVAIVTALNNMQGYPGDYKSRAPCHDDSKSWTGRLYRTRLRGYDAASIELTAHSYRMAVAKARVFRSRAVITIEEQLAEATVPKWWSV